MALEWLKRDANSNSSSGSDIELKPEDFRKLATTTEDLHKRYEEGSKAQDAKLDTVLAYIAEQQATTARQQQEREAAEAAARAKNKKPINFEDDFDGSLKQVLDPIAENQLRINARELRKNTLVEDEEFGEYYTGDFKKRVDSLLDAEPLANQNNPAIIKNAYKSVYFDLQQEIKEGKIKSRFAAASRASSGTGAPSQDKNASQSIELTEAEKRVALRMGIKPEDYAKSRNYLREAGVV